MYKNQNVILFFKKELKKRTQNYTTERVIASDLTLQLSFKSFIVLGLQVEKCMALSVSLERDKTDHLMGLFDQ